MLSTITVNTFNDQIDPSGSATISLRDAVTMATNAGPSSSTTIDLPAGTYTLGSNGKNVGTGELQVGGIVSGQTINFVGLGTAANIIINQTVADTRIFNFDNAQTGTEINSLSNLTLQGATNVNQAFGGGAILAGGIGDSLTLTSCVVQNNSTTNGTSAGSKNGGGIAFGADGNLTIANCVFSNDTAGGNSIAGSIGGAIEFNNNAGVGVLTISNSTFNNDSATGFDSGGGAVFESGSGNFSITSSTFTNNSVTGTSSSGGAIQVSGQNVTNVNIVRSRFFDDSAPSGSGIANYNAAITANNNWWGADAFPGAAGTDTVAEEGSDAGASITVSTRLALALAPTSSMIGTGASTALTAMIVSTSAPTVPVTGTALEGLALTFAPGTLGSVNPTGATISGGIASTTFNAGSSFGTTSPAVSLDNGTKTTTVTIVGAPTANSQADTVGFNTAKAITLTASDPNNPPQSLTYFVNQPAHGTLAGTAPNLTYTPTAGYHGTDSFTFTVKNQVATSNTATVTLNVAAGIPTANPQTVAVAHDSSGTPITLAASDPDVPTLTLTYAFTQPSHGTVTVSGAAGSPTVTYTPAAGYHGSDSFTFTANNGSNTSNPATVTLNVAVGTPAANPQAVSTPQNTAVAVTLTGSDDDVPVLTLTYAVATGPAHGTLSGTAPHLTYTPAAGYSGPDSFSFTLSNGTNTSAPATVSITVAAPTVATVAGTLGVTWGSAGTATLLTDADGLRLLPSGRTTDIPWLGIKTLAITLSQPETLLPSEVSLTGIAVAGYPVTISGSGTNYTITLLQPIDAADRVTLSIAGANLAGFTRRLDVLPGDVNDDGLVNAQDVAVSRNMYLGLTVSVSFGDVLGDGTVDLADYAEVRKLVGTTLPPIP